MKIMSWNKELILWLFCEPINDNGDRANSDACASWSILLMMIGALTIATRVHAYMVQQFNEKWKWYPISIPMPDHHWWWQSGLIMMPVCGMHIWKCTTHDVWCSDCSSVGAHVQKCSENYEPLANGLFSSCFGPFHTSSNEEELICLRFL